MRIGIILGQQIADFARLALVQDDRTAELDGELVLLRPEDLEGAAELVEEFAPRFGRRRQPLAHEGLEIGLRAVLRTPERGALVNPPLRNGVI